MRGFGPLAWHACPQCGVGVIRSRVCPPIETYCSFGCRLRAGQVDFCPACGLPLSDDRCIYDLRAGPARYTDAGDSLCRWCGNLDGEYWNNDQMVVCYHRKQEAANEAR